MFKSISQLTAQARFPSNFRPQRIAKEQVPTPHKQGNNKNSRDYTSQKQSTRVQTRVQGSKQIGQGQIKGANQHIQGH
jgi:hypothetical protein